MNIQFYNSIDINIFSCVILMVIIINTFIRTRDLPLSARYRVLLSCTLLLIFIMDIVSRIDLPYSKQTNHTILYIVDLIYFLLQPLPVSIGLMYLFSIYRERRFSFRCHLLFLLPFFVGLAALIYSVPTGFIFYIDNANVYHRGPGMFIYAITNYSFAIPAFALTFHFRDVIKRRTLWTIIAYTTFPYIGSLFQLRFYGILTAWPSFTLGLLVIYVFLEVQRNERDYLTGVLNRQNFDSRIHTRIDQYSRKGAFTLVVIDLNKFKSINDLYGHDKGDEFLQAAAALLSRSISMADTVARYGGDEFVLLLETAYEPIVKTVLNRINQNIVNWNNNNQNSVGLSCSSGYVVYDPEFHSGFPDLFREADVKMFENKEAQKEMANNNP